MNQIIILWKNIEKWMRKNAPFLVTTLNPGATPIQIKDFEQRILSGGGLSISEALSLLELKDSVVLDRLFSAANRIREKFRGKRVDLCSLTNAKSGDCSQDCSFCAQSSHSNTTTNTYPLSSAEEMLASAARAYKNKAHRFCIVTSGCFVDEEEFKEICRAIKLIKQNSTK